MQRRIQHHPRDRTSLPLPLQRPRPNLPPPLLNHHLHHHLHHHPAPPARHPRSLPPRVVPRHGLQGRNGQNGPNGHHAHHEYYHSHPANHHPHLNPARPSPHAHHPSPHGPRHRPNHDSHPANHHPHLNPARPSPHAHHPDPHGPRRRPNHDMDRFVVESRTGKRPPPKTIFLVRHGQSTHNAHSLRYQGADLNDIRYVDAPLTTLGESQARELAPTLPALRPELLVTSPLTRATQTCLLACSRLPRPQQLVVHPLCVERLAYACDVGSPVQELENRFPGLDYGRVRPKEAWWWTPDEGRWGQMESLRLLWRFPPGAYKDVEPKETFKKRADDFRVWLLERPEKRIAVFAHGVFLTALMGEGTAHFRNAELRKWIL